MSATVPNSAKALSRLFAKVREDGDCWVWTGAADRYGRMVLNGKRWWTHRLSYTLLVEDIPAGQQIDHLCRNRLCLRPDHLEAVPQRLNVARGIGPSAVNGRKTECAWGHAFTPENTRYGPSGDRTCRACHRARERQRRVAQLLDRNAVDPSRIPA